MLIFLPLAGFAIVPPQNPNTGIPREMLDNLSTDPFYYMPKRGLVHTMQSFRERKVTPSLRKNNMVAPVNASIPVLCARYADVPEDEWPISQLQKMLFGDWPTGSMRDYYEEVSYGQLSLTGKVYGWLGVSGDSEYYERANVNAGRLLEEMLTFYDNTVDFSLYDNDGPDGLPNSGDDDGFVDVVVIVHSGPGGEEKGGPEIWSHFASYSNENDSVFVTNDGQKGGGKIKIDDHMIVPASQYGEMVNIGVFCHEFGHALGLPDLYDRDYSSSGAGHWCVMSSGMWGGDGRSPETPSHFSPWCKELLGWITPVVPEQNKDNVEISPVETTPVVYKLWKKGQIDPFNYQNHLGSFAPLGREYFLIENRQKTGFDKTLPGSGLLIWHVDNTVPDSSGNDNEQHKLLDLEEADGLNQLNRYGNKGDAGDPFPGTTGKSIFDKHSTPNSRAYDGSGSKVAVTDISLTGNLISADLQVIADDLEIAGYTIDDKYGNQNGYLDPGETVDLYVSIINNGNFVERIDVTISTKDPFIHIDNNFAEYSNLKEDETQINSGPFVISAAQNIKRHPVLLEVSFRTGSGYSADRDMIVYMENNRILLVDDSRGEKDSNGKSIASYYSEALDQIDHLEYDVWVVEEQMNPTRFVMKEYGLVIWFTGSQDFSFSLNEMANFRNLMYNGWKLFFIGQNIGRHLMTAGTDVERSFFQDWMHARYISDDVNGHKKLKITGITGDPISDSFRPYFYASGGDGADNQFSASVVAPDQEATPVFEYADYPGQYAAIKYDGDYKMVYFAFSFEAINDKDSGGGTRRNVMRKVVAWFQGSVITDTEQETKKNEIVSNRFMLYQNYPNPFNSVTSITCFLNDKADISLKIFDISGREVFTLAEAEKQPGLYSFKWNGQDRFGKDAASGVYIYRLVINEYTETKKMILLR